MSVSTPPLIRFKGGYELQVKLPDELEYTTASFCYNLQEGDLTVPCADGSVWRYENKKWTRWNKSIEDFVKLTRINDIEGLGKFIDEGGDINIQDENGFTPLMVAIREEKEEIVELLIKAGADLKNENRMGETALIMSIKSGRIDFAEMLFKGGADLGLYYAINLAKRPWIGKTRLIELLIKCKKIELARDLENYLTKEARRKLIDSVDSIEVLMVSYVYLPLLVFLIYLFSRILEYYHLI